LVDQLKEKLKQSMYVETACAACGVTQLTVQAWLRMGRDFLERLESGQIREYQLTESQITCVDLYIEITQIIAENEIKDLQALEELVMEGDFRAIKFRLERRSPERWGKRDHLTIDDGQNSRVSQEPRVVDYSQEIQEAEEFKMLEETFEPSSITDVEIIREEKPDAKQHAESD
jgi:hypothetical protein